MSFGFDASPGELGDGTSVLSSFVDWSSDIHDVLYVVAGNQDGVVARRLIDNFNGITVAYSKKDSNGRYSVVDNDNVFPTNPLSPFTERTYTDLLAPGHDVIVASQGNTSNIVSGTSYAAPHVTGTVALLQEYANTQITNGVAGWTPLARRHEVMKAVLMNSADKIEDDGTFVPFGKVTPVPVGGLLGMTRTVEKIDGSDWDDSDAAYDNLIPLDEEMGAGHLNAARAVEQFSSGAQGPNGVAVPVVGWDYDSTAFSGDTNKYVLNQELLLDSYISITLAWDREVTFASDGGTPGAFDSGDTFNGYNEFDADDVINDLNIYLMPKGATDPFSEAVWESSQDFMPLEHLFVPIEIQGEYEIWIRQMDADLGGGQNYALAWWALGTGPLLTGDFDNDNDVDGADFLAWQSGFGAPYDANDLADWDGNFGAGSGALATATSVPEPTTGMLLLFGALFSLRVGRRRPAKSVSGD